MQPTFIQFVLYFLRLGALGFGGPVALTNALRRDLVETRLWLTPDEFENGLALAAACPGPLAYQLGIYCGYIRFGIAGGLAVAVAFGLPPFVIVTAAAWLYVRFAADWHLRALFYGIAPAIVALIINACWNLGRRTLRADRIAWIFAIAACAITVIATPILLRYHKNPRLAGFIRGVGVTVVGVLVGTSYLVAQQAIGDWLTGSIAIASLVVIIMWKKIPEPIIIAAAGTVGLVAYRWMS
ncbi:MAG TPA: chromate transporter [Thermoanaerobaculia bacterium]|jgi:chromate transport protein ChrA|nr:chromate transporter [Thermoanaerobaculia bacterium]